MDMSCMILCSYVVLFCSLALILWPSLPAYITLTAKHNNESSIVLSPTFIYLIYILYLYDIIKQTSMTRWYTLLAVICGPYLSNFVSFQNSAYGANRKLFSTFPVYLLELLSTKRLHFFISHVSQNVLFRHLASSE